MVSAVRRRMQEGVNLARGLGSAIDARNVADLAVIAEAPAILERVIDLAAGIVLPETDGIARIQSRIRAAIAGLSITELTVDTATVDTVRNQITRGILQAQVPEVVVLFLVDAVIGGVEQGLRDLIRAHASRGASSHPPLPVLKSFPADRKSQAPPAREPAITTQHAPPKLRAGGPIPTPEDTVDI